MEVMVRKYGFIRKVFAILKRRKTFILTRKEFFKLSYVYKKSGYFIYNTLTYQHQSEYKNERLCSVSIGQSNSNFLIIIIENFTKDHKTYFKSKMYNWNQITDIEVTLNKSIFSNKLINLEGNFPREIIFFSKEKNIILNFNNNGIVTFRENSN